MKKLILLFIALNGFSVCLNSFVYAQGVGINSSGSNPDPSAILDASSTTKGILYPRLTNLQRDNLISPANGLTIFNLSTGCINYYFINKWMELCGICTPQPSTANAGTDQLNINGTTAIMSANTPVNGNGSWSIVTGSGGNFSSAANPSSVFTGLINNSYTLRWTITTPCGSTQDDMDVSFICSPQPTISNAGPDQLNVSGNTATLAANTPTNGTGAWSILSGSGGSLTNSIIPATTFAGLGNSSYTLRWTITSACGSSSDDVIISFAPAATEKKFFMTSTLYSANFGSLANADVNCQSRASAGGLSGSFKAILSDASTSAASRLNHATVPYKMVNGSVIANDWNDLMDGAVQNLPQADEFGNVMANVRAWTGSDLNGNINASTCNSWTSNSNTVSGMTGSNFFTDSRWIQRSTQTCDLTFRFYCIEQ